MHVDIAICDDAGYFSLLNELGPVTHHCPRCASSWHGRPSITGGFISISHPGSLHVVATADSPVGVDAELAGTGEGIGSVTLHPLERQLLYREATEAELLRIWVAKEAVLKLVGHGLQIAPESFVVRREDGWRVAAGELAAEPIELSWIDWPDGPLALAHTGALDSVTVRDLRAGMAGETRLGG